jgi:hypothetical protein
MQPGEGGNTDECSNTMAVAQWCLPHMVRAATWTRATPHGVLAVGCLAYMWSVSKPGGA